MLELIRVDIVLHPRSRASNDKDEISCLVLSGAAAEVQPDRV